MRPYPTGFVSAIFLGLGIGQTLVVAYRTGGGRAWFAVALVVAGAACSIWERHRLGLWWTEWRRDQ